jgi:hypothetical protein
MTPYSRRQFLKIAAHSLLTSSLGALGSYKYATSVEPDWLTVETLDIPISKLSQDYDGLHLVHFSDIHVDHWMNSERLARVISTVNSLSPDLIAITGDFVSEDPKVHQDMMVENFSKLTAPLGVFAVLGNHDHWTDAGAVRRILKRSGIRGLRNDTVAIQREGRYLWIAGVDDIWEEQHDLPHVIEQLPKGSSAILLAHEPDFADEVAATHRFQLQLSGHSHGGQVVVPFMQPPVLPRLGRKYHTGLYRVGAMWQYTTRGVGMVSPQVRFNCRPEITSIRLRSA